MPEESKPEDESHIDDGTTVHNEAEAIQLDKESHEKAPELPESVKSNTEGVGVSEMQSAREKHSFMQ